METEEHVVTHRQLEAALKPLQETIAALSAKMDASEKVMQVEMAALKDKMGDMSRTQGWIVMLSIAVLTVMPALVVGLWSFVASKTTPLG